MNLAYNHEYSANGENNVMELTDQEKESLLWFRLMGCVDENELFELNYAQVDYHPSELMIAKLRHQDLVVKIEPHLGAASSIFQLTEYGDMVVSAIVRKQPLNF